MSAPPAETAQQRPAAGGRRAAFFFLAALGLAIAWVRGAAPWESAVQFATLLAAVAAVAVPAIRDRVWAGIERARNATPRTVRLTAFAIWAVAFMYLVASAYWQNRPLTPGMHDEQMYLLQAHLLAHGKLWTAAHPMADFFETFYVFHKPVYAPIYFPGAALACVPAVWLGLPHWVIPAAVAAGVIALVYLVVTRLLDGASGIVAALLVPSLAQFRVQSVMAMSNLVLVLFALLATWAWLRWRRTTRGAGMAAVIGAAMGWAAITRPIDALCYAVPLGVAMLLDLRGLPFRRGVAVLLAAALAAAPFLALQAILNVGVTGSMLKTPATLYAEQEWPGLTFLGFRDVPPGARPASSLPQKHELYEELIRPHIAEHRPGQIAQAWLGYRFGVIATATLPDSLLIAPLVAGLLGVWTQRWWVLFATLPLFVAAYALNPFLLYHYPLTVVPAVLMTVMAGFRLAEQLWPGARTSVGVLSVILPVGLALSALPELNSNVKDNRGELPTMRWVYQTLPTLVRQPALVLFTYTPGVDVCHEEPVYNIDVVNIDDAPIVKAHDLGPERARELIRYYGERQPGRRVYVCDRSTRRLADLGTAGELMRAMEAGGPTPPPPR